MRFYIKEAREEAGFSQRELAEIVGVAPNTFHGYESGKHDPKSDLLVKIASACHVSVDFLLGIQNKESKKITPLYSSEARKLAKDFDTLDSHGQSAVRGLMDEELNRMAELDELAKFREPEEETIIPRYLSPYAAGIASPIFGEEYEDYTLQSGDPKGAIFAVKVQGDSMEPYIKDGSTVFCNKDPLRDGDIGVFIVDGAGVIKQYHKEGGIVYLFSLNRKRSDADVMLPPSSGRNLSCQGRVITKRKFPIPGR